MLTSCLPEGGVKFRNFQSSQVLQRTCYLLSWGDGVGVGKLVAGVADGIVLASG